MFSNSLAGTFPGAKNQSLSKTTIISTYCAKSFLNRIYQQLFKQVANTTNANDPVVSLEVDYQGFETKKAVQVKMTALFLYH
jgi:hypothetical protein